MNSKTRKNIFNGLFLVALIVFTVWAVFKDQDLGKIITLVSDIHPIFLIIGFTLVIVYVCSESVIIKYLLHTVHIHQCITASDTLLWVFSTVVSLRLLPADSLCRFII